jgi:hypothetical protein
VVSERHVAEKFRYHIGKNRCGIGISDVVHLVTQISNTQISNF